MTLVNAPTFYARTALVAIGPNSRGRKIYRFAAAAAVTLITLVTATGCGSNSYASLTREQALTVSQGALLKITREEHKFAIIDGSTTRFTIFPSDGSGALRLALFETRKGRSPIGDRAWRIYYIARPLSGGASTTVCLAVWGNDRRYQSCTNS